MSKRIIGMTLLMLCLASSAFAAIPRNQMHIGKLKLGMTLEQVTVIYGTPVADTSGTKASRRHYYIANGLFGGWIDEKTNSFDQIYFDERKTGADSIIGAGGIRLGMTIAEVEKQLGKPDSLLGNSPNAAYLYHSVEHGISWREHDNFNVFFNNGRVRAFTINVF